MGKLEFNYIIQMTWLVYLLKRSKIYLNNFTQAIQKAVYVLRHTERWDQMNGVLSITGTMLVAES